MFAVETHAGTGRDELADDHVLLEALEPVGAAFDRRFGEHPGGLLERSRRQPRVGCERRLRDSHELRTALGGSLVRLDEAAVLLGVTPGIHLLAGQEALSPGSETVTRRNIWRDRRSATALSWTTAGGSRSKARPAEVAASACSYRSGGKARTVGSPAEPRPLTITFLYTLPFLFLFVPFAYFVVPTLRPFPSAL